MNAAVALSSTNCSTDVRESFLHENWLKGGGETSYLRGAWAFVYSYQQDILADINRHQDNQSVPISLSAPNLCLTGVECTLIAAECTD